MTSADRHAADRHASAPRSAWLAVGTVAAALLVPAVVGGLGLKGPPAAAAIGALLIAVALVAIVARRPGRRVSVAGRGDRTSTRAGRAAALTVGAAAVAFRIALGGSGANPAVPLPAGSGPWTATIEGVGSPRSGQQGATLRLEPDGPVVAATLPRYPEVAPGDRVRVDGRLEPAPPDDGGYGTYLRRIGATATLRARSMATLVADDTPGRRIEGLRRTAGEALTRSLPEPEAGLAAGILIGLRDRVDRDLAAAFTIAGVSHVVAISGWNIAIVAAVVAALLRGRTGRRSRSLATLGAIVAYTVVAGASASVVRAALMAAVVLLARESGRAGRAAPALGWAVALLLVADPHTVADPGFQLSVLATAGLLAWGSRLTERLRAWRAGRLPGWLAESLGVSFAAEAATLPVVLASFGRLAVLAPAVNLAVVPLVPPAMAAGSLALVGGWLSLAGAPPAVGVVLGLPAWLILTVLVAVVRAAASLPFASATLPAPVGTIAGLVVGLVVFLVARGGHRAVAAWIVARRRRPQHRSASRADDPATSAGTGSVRASLKVQRRPARIPRRMRLLATTVVLCVVAIGIAGAARPDGLVHVTVLDVGQGDAILVEGGHGGRLLVDGGPDPDRLLVDLDARIPPWDRRIDLLVLTHPHEDHVAGLALLLGRYRVGRVFEPGMIGPGPGYRAWVAALARLGVRPAILATGDTFGLDGIGFRVLWPDRGAVPREPADGGTAINNVSIVLLGTYGRQRFLLAGDIEEGIDPTLVARGLPPVDFLKVAHHGSRTASTDAFLDAVRPRVAIASAGAGNPYGHPAPGTLARISVRGARVFRTDRDGSVEVSFDGQSRLDVRPDRRVADGPAAILRPAAVVPAVGAGPVAFSCGLARPGG